MNTTLSLLLDLVILGLLVYWFLMGMRRGLVLSLCSLLSVLISFAGGWYLSTYVAQPLAEQLEPMLIQAIHEQVSDNLPTTESDLQFDLEQSGPLGIFSQGLQDHLNQQLDSAKTITITQVASAMAHFIARALLFLVGFLGLQLVWNILFHALNLVAKLPGLHTLNKVLGGVFGLVKGILLLLLARWLLCDLLGWIPSYVAQESRMLSLFASLPFVFGG